MARALVLAVVLGLGWASAAAPAPRLAQVGAESIEIYVRAGIPQAVSFPEGIEAIHTGVNPDALSLELDGQRLFIQALEADFEARLFVTGSSGRMYQLRLMEGDGEPDDAVQLVLPRAPPVFGVEPPQPVGSPPSHRTGRQRQSPLRRLLVAMIDGNPPPGVSVVKHVQKLLETEALVISTRKLYVAGRYLGYVAVAENRTSGPLALRLPEYQAAGLKAVAAEQETLGARESTRVYLVIKPGSPY